MAKEYTNFFIPRHPKIYQNLDFWFENIPSGNPDRHQQSVFNFSYLFPAENHFPRTFRLKKFFGLKKILQKSNLVGQVGGDVKIYILNDSNVKYLGTQWHKVGKLVETHCRHLK
jgi:hypothetical protein